MKRCLLRGSIAAAVFACALAAHGEQETSASKRNSIWPRVDEAADTPTTQGLPVADTIPAAAITNTPATSVAPADTPSGSPQVVPQATTEVAAPRRLPTVLPMPPAVPVRPNYPVTAASGTMPTMVPPSAAGVLAYYNNPQAAATLSQIPGRPVTARPPQRMVGAAAKPFAAVDREPTISPYLNLFRDDLEGNKGVSNYFTLVRPQLRQQQANQQQFREIQRLEQQVRTLQYQQDLGTTNSAGVPATGHRTRFFDTGAFYVQPRRR